MISSIASSSFADSGSSIYSVHQYNDPKNFENLFSRSYTSVENKELIPNLSIKSRKAIERLDSFYGLNENWDSYGAERPSEISIHNAKEFIKKADRDGFEVFFVAPGRNGDVLVEYKLSEHISSEVYFNKDNSNELLIFGDNECFTEGTIEEN